MAEQRRGTRRYRTYGSLAYQPEYEQEPVRAPSRRGRPADSPGRPRPRKRPAARPSVQVRAQTAVSPFAVAGLLAVLACALLLVMGAVQLAVVNNDIVGLRRTLSELQDEGRTLQARYEMEFDLEAIERQFLSNGAMARAGAGQTVYLDLSGGDSVVYYDGAGDSLSALVQRAERFLSDLLS